MEEEGIVVASPLLKIAPGSDFGLERSRSSAALDDDVGVVTPLLPSQARGGISETSEKTTVTSSSQVRATLRDVQNEAALKVEQVAAAEKEHSEVKQIKTKEEAKAFNDELLEQRIKEELVKAERMQRLAERRLEQQEERRKQQVKREVQELKAKFEEKRKSILRGPRFSSFAKNPFGAVLCALRIPAVRLTAMIGSNGFLSVWKSSTRERGRKQTMVDFCAAIGHKTTKINDVVVCACFCGGVARKQMPKAPEKSVRARFFCSDYSGRGSIIEATVLRAPQLPPPDLIEFYVPELDAHEDDSERRRSVRMARRLSRKRGSDAGQVDANDEAEKNEQYAHAHLGWTHDRWKKAWDSDPSSMLKSMNMDADVDMSRWIVDVEIACSRPLSTAHQVTSCASASYEKDGDVTTLIITCAHDYIKAWNTRLCNVWTIALSEHIPAAILSTPHGATRRLSSLGTGRSKIRSSFSAQASSGGANAVDISKDVVRCICALSGRMLCLGLGNAQMVLLEWGNLDHIWRKSAAEANGNPDDLWWTKTLQVGDQPFQGLPAEWSLRLPQLGAPPLEGDKEVVEISVKCLDEIPESSKEGAGYALKKSALIKFRMSLAHKFSHSNHDEKRIRKAALTKAGTPDQVQKTNDEPQKETENAFYSLIKIDRSGEASLFKPGFKAPIETLHPVFDISRWSGNTSLSQTFFEEGVSAAVSGNAKEAAPIIGKGAAVEGFIAGCMNGLSYLFAPYAHDYDAYFAQKEQQRNEEKMADVASSMSRTDSRKTLVRKRTANGLKRAVSQLDIDSARSPYFSPNMPFAIAAILVNDRHIYEENYHGIVALSEYAEAMKQHGQAPVENIDTITAILLIESGKNTERRKSTDAGRATSSIVTGSVNGKLRIYRPPLLHTQEDNFAGPRVHFLNGEVRCIAPRHATKGSAVTMLSQDETHESDGYFVLTSFNEEGVFRWTIPSQ